MDFTEKRLYMRHLLFPPSFLFMHDLSGFAVKKNSPYAIRYSAPGIEWGIRTFVHLIPLPFHLSLFFLFRFQFFVVAHLGLPIDTVMVAFFLLEGNETPPFPLHLSRWLEHEHKITRAVITLTGNWTLCWTLNILASYCTKAPRDAACSQILPIHCDTFCFSPAHSLVGASAIY